MPGSPAATAEPDFRTYLNVIRRRKWWVIACTVVCLGAALAYSFTATKKYSATVQLQVQPQSGAVTLNGTAQTINPTDVATELQLATSNPVQASVVGKLGFKPKVSATQVGQTDVIAITATSTKAAEAARIANTYARAFVTYERTVSQQNYTSAELQLQNQISSIDAEISGVKAGTPEATALANQEAILKEQLAQLEVTGAVTSGGIEIVSPATAPKSPSSPKKTEDSLLGLLVGLIVGLGAAFVVDYMDDAVYSKADIERIAPDAPVLAMVPMVNSWKDPETPYIITQADPLSPPAEAYRSLRTSLQFAGHDGNMRLLLVTSPMATEGKTSTISNLGVVLAQSGQSVALVSGDLRRPRLATFFGVDDTVGLTSVIIGETELSDALVPIDSVPGLVMLPTGPIPPNPSELLASSKMRQILRGLKEKFDLVIVDSPPLLPVTDPVVLAQEADVTLVVVAAGQTKKGQLDQALEQLRQVNAPRVGVVLNGLSREGGNYGYGYGYGYRYESVAQLDASTNGAASTNGHGPKPAGESGRRQTRRQRRAASKA